MSRSKLSKPVKNPSGVFMHKGFLYSISDRNMYGEYVVIKGTMDDNMESDTYKQVTVLDVRVIKATHIGHVQKLIDKYDFTLFPKLEGAENLGQIH